MYREAYIFLILLAPLTLEVSCLAKKTKSVTTLLEAKWEATQLVLEVVEYLGDENVNHFWSFIDSISALNPSLSSIGMANLLFLWFIH